MSLLHHGGRLRQAAIEHRIPLSDWLDLSTGVAPWTYPIPAIELSHWNRLPETDDGLELAAAKYYGSEMLPLAVAGSQAAIQQLPKHLDGKRVALPRVGYKEHQKAWQQANWEIELYDLEPSQTLLDSVDALVVINPNNPTAHRISPSHLIQWHQQLNAKGGTLVVDEAFMDLWPSDSVIHQTGTSGLVVLRSIGKFFGLAGARVGFVFGWPKLLEQLSATLGPWCVTGPARQVAKTALLDDHWQQQQHQRIDAMANQLTAVLCSLPGTHHQCGLFITVIHPDAPHWHHQCARQGVYLRLTDEHHGLRFGLPKDTQQLQRLTKVLQGLVPSC